MFNKSTENLCETEYSYVMQIQVKSIKYVQLKIPYIAYVYKSAAKTEMLVTNR